MQDAKKIATEFLKKVRDSYPFMVSDLYTTEDNQDVFLFFAERNQQFVDLGKGAIPLPPANYHLMMVFQQKENDQLEFIIRMLPSDHCESSCIRNAKTFSLSEDLKHRETKMVLNVFFKSILQIVDRLEDKALQTKLQRYNYQSKLVKPPQPK